MTAHDAAYLARQINKTANWVRRHAADLPHSKAGRTYYWDDEDVRAVIEHMRVRPAAAASSPMRDEMRPVPTHSRRRAS